VLLGKEDRDEARKGKNDGWRREEILRRRVGSAHDPIFKRDQILILSLVASGS
jgi:hypothetical protein